MFSGYAPQLAALEDIRLLGVLVDALEWFRAPVLIGGEGRPGVGALAVAALAAAPHFRRIAVHELGPDVWERYART